ncbi:MAG: hypothetical protein K9J42_15740 [Sulfuritalea sp.]|nr:hypothetical protein [Sulfuritalea sp.]
MNARKQTKEETQAMLKVGVSLSRLSLCEGGGFNGLSELDQALEENCEAWLPGSDRHKKCKEKKQPKPAKKSPEKKPESRLNNAQLAALDKALQKSVGRPGTEKGDALDRVLAPKPKPTVTASSAANADIRETNTKQIASGGSSTQSPLVGQWTEITPPFYQHLVEWGSIAFLGSRDCKPPDQLSDDTLNPLRAHVRSCRNGSDCSLTINPDKTFRIVWQSKSNVACEIRGNYRNSGKDAISGRSDTGCTKIYFRPLRKDGPAADVPAHRVPAAEKLGLFENGYLLAITLLQPGLKDINGKNASFYRCTGKENGFILSRALFRR